MKIRRLFIVLFVLVLAVAFTAPNATAKYGLKKWFLAVNDDDGEIIDDQTITVNVYTVDTTTNATVYSDENGTAQSNPWDITDGKVEFYTATTSQDIQVNVGSRGALLEDATASSTHRITIEVQQTGIQKVINLPLMSFVDVTTETPLDENEAPTLEGENAMGYIEWADGETDVAGITFRVPYDYQTGGSFRIWADQAAGTAPANASAIDFSVYLNSDETAWDAAVTDQTPVALSGDPGSPEELTLTVATDFANLAAGDLVALNIWRDDTTYTGTDSLEIYYVEFVYTAQR